MTALNIPRENDECASYNRDSGGLPQVLLSKPSWLDRNGDTVAIDNCIAKTVEALWSVGYHTLSSCCGHGRDKPSLVLDPSENPDEVRGVIEEVDGREFRLYQWKLTEV